MVYQPAYWIHAAIFLPLSVIVCVGLLRPTKGLLIALQYFNKAEEGRQQSMSIRRARAGLGPAVATAVAVRRC